MSGALKASFTLTLEDKLSSGLKEIKSALQDLRDVGKDLTLGKLDGGRAVESIRTVTREVKALTGSFDMLQATASRAWNGIKNASRPVMNWGAKTFGPQSRLGVFAAAAAGYSVVEPIRSYAAFQNIALHSAITKGLSGPAATAEANRLMRLFQTDALATGQSSTSIGQAYQDLIQTGMSSELAEKLLPIHSRAATAYNISPEALGHAVFALSDSFKIGEGDMGGALASMALASKEGRFKVEDFSRFLPSIGANMAKLGMTGRGSADLAFAALETVMKNSADPGSGAANFTDFLNYLTSPHAARSFALDSRGMAPETRAILNQYGIRGINMPKLLENARKLNIDPISAVIGTLQAKVKNLPPEVLAEVLGAFFTNQQSRDAALAMLLHAPDLVNMRGHLAGADSNMLGRDFDTGFNAPQVQLQVMHENLDQLENRLGQGFSPLIGPLNTALEGVLSGIKALDDHLPGLGDAVISVTGALLAAAAAIGAIGFVAPAFKAGGALLGGVVGGGARLLGGLAAANPLGALAIGTGLVLKLGSDAETPENRKALDQLAKERQSLEGGPQGQTYDGFNVDGTPKSSPAPAEPAKAELTIRTEPGTTATVNSASPGLKVTINPGQSVNKP
jgi:TP901 family phage tail tape measure protein